MHFGFCPRKVMVSWVCAHVGEQYKAIAFLYDFVGFAAGVFYVSKESGSCRTGEHAGRFSVLGRERLVVYPVYAQGALFHDFVRLIKLSTPIRTGPRAELTAYAVIVVYEHNPILLPLVAGTRGTHRYARRILTVKAGLGKVKHLCVGKLTYLVGHYPVVPYTLRLSPVGVKVREGTKGRLRVPLLTVGGTGMTTYAGV